MFRWMNFKLIVVTVLDRVEDDLVITVFERWFTCFHYNFVKNRALD